MFRYILGQYKVNKAHQDLTHNKPEILEQDIAKASHQLDFEGVDYPEQNIIGTDNHLLKTNQEVLFDIVAQLNKYIHELIKKSGIEVKQLLEKMLIDINNERINKKIVINDVYKKISPENIKIINDKNNYRFELEAIEKIEKLKAIINFYWSIESNPIYMALIDDIRNHMNTIVHHYQYVFIDYLNYKELRDRIVEKFIIFPIDADHRHKVLCSIADVDQKEEDSDLIKVRELLQVILSQLPILNTNKNNLFNAQLAKQLTEIVAAESLLMFPIEHHLESSVIDDPYHPANIIRSRQCYLPHIKNTNKNILDEATAAYKKQLENHKTNSSKFLLAFTHSNLGITQEIYFNKICEILESDVQKEDKLKNTTLLFISVYYAYEYQGLEQILAEVVKRQNLLLENSKEIYIDFLKTLAPILIKEDQAALMALLKHRPDIINEPITNDNKTLLHLAVEEDQKKLVYSLLAIHRIDKYVKDKEGNTPLHIAARKDYSDIVDLLINNGTEVNIENHNKETPLICALKSGAKVNIRILIPHSLISAQDKEKKTALHWAIEKKCDEYIINNLIDKAERDVANEPDKKERHIVNISDKEGKTLLEYAVEYHRSKIFKRLLPHANPETIIRTKHIIQSGNNKLIQDEFDSYMLQKQLDDYKLRRDRDGEYKHYLFGIKCNTFGLGYSKTDKFKVVNDFKKVLAGNKDFKHFWFTGKNADILQNRELGEMVKPFIATHFKRP